MNGEIHSTNNDPLLQSNVYTRRLFKLDADCRSIFRQSADNKVSFEHELLIWTQLKL